jgi:hypothetical protein
MADITSPPTPVAAVNEPITSNDNDHGHGSISRDAMMNVALGIILQYILMYILGEWVKRGAHVGYARVSMMSLSSYLVFVALLFTLPSSHFFGHRKSTISL